MHTRVGVIVKRYGTNEKTIEVAKKVLAKFSRNPEVKPYKEYPAKSYVEQLLRNYKVRSLEALAASGVDWKNGEEGGIDAKGLYFISTQNPQGVYDAWQLLGNSAVIVPGVFASDENACGDIITPDGTLHKGPIIRKTNWLARRQLAAWSHTLERFAVEYSGMSLVIFDCHS